jgi:transcriptional regulator with XRE-family HTH domain
VIPYYNTTYILIEVSNHVNRFLELSNKGGFSMPSIADRIAALVANKGVSFTSISAEIGVSASALTEWKKGKANPSVDAIIKISNHFGVTTDYLLKGIGGSESDVTDSVPLVDKALTELNSFSDYDDIIELRELLQEPENKRALNVVRDLANVSAPQSGRSRRSKTPAQATTIP